MRMRIIVIAILSLIAGKGFAQDKNCGTAELHNEIMANNPEKRKLYEQLEQYTQEYIKQHRGEKQGTVYVIPIVFHVIHNYGFERIGKAQILSAINIINKDYRGQNSDTNKVASAFKPIIADPEIEFRLATLDPNGNCTEGITYHQSELTFEAGNNVKDIVSWDTDKYLNVWVVDRIASGAGGYSYYPGTVQQKYEGIVVLNRQLGSTGTSGGSNFAKRTLTHEAGHFFNLPHTWGSTNQVAVQSNCSKDDGVFDTPNTIGTSQTCNLTQNTCNSLDNVNNYMDYASCTRMFTNGQKTRMHAALNSTAGKRNNLWQPFNLVVTGTDSNYTPACKPIADFNPAHRVYCVGDSVEFTDYSYNGTVDSTWSWSWNFPGATPSASADQNPTVVYYNPGTYNVTLTVTNPNGSDAYTRQNIVTVIADSTGMVTPFFEGFEASTFPQDPSDPLKDWTIEAPSINTWKRNTDAGFWGSAASVRINPAAINTGEEHSLISPVIDMDSVNNEELRFRLAFSRKDTNAKSFLKIYVSSDCGQSWKIRYVGRADAGLLTVPTFINPPFIPNSWDWKEEIAYLQGYQGKKVRVKFTFEDNGDGNYLYLDHINLGGHPLGIQPANIPVKFNVYPNPSTGNATISFTPNTDNVSISVYNISGQLMGSKVLKSLIAGKQSKVDLHNITGTLPTGYYMIKVSSGNGTPVSKPLIITSY